MKYEEYMEALIEKSRCEVQKLLFSVVPSTDRAKELMEILLDAFVKLENLKNGEE